MNYKRLAVRIVVILALVALAGFTAVVLKLSKTFDEWEARMKSTGPSLGQIMDAARPRAVVLQEFLSIFTNAEVTHVSGPKGPSYNAAVNLHGRYEFTLRLPLQWNGTNIVGFREPQFFLHEVASVTREPSGNLMMSYETSGQRRFGQEEWRKLVGSNGDFRAIGYNMVTNQPAPGFERRNNRGERK